MHVHGPDCFQGPITKERPWWKDADLRNMEVAPALPSGHGATKVNSINENHSKPSDAPIRTELVERIRREIAAGTYDTPEKLDAALDRMLKRLAEE